MEITPQALCIEIEKHEKYLALVYAGIVKLSKRTIQKREKYVADLKNQLMEFTNDESLDDSLTNEQLLAELL